MFRIQSNTAHTNAISLQSMTLLNHCLCQETVVLVRGLAPAATITAKTVAAIKIARVRPA